MMKVILVCGARPNFMKIAPLMRAINSHNEASGSDSIEPILAHTGQHYDYEMSKVFFENLELPEPDIHLGIGSGTHAEQTGRAMMRLEKVMIKEEPDLVIVVGDVNSTLAGALAAAKLHIPVAHVEAGLRSYDMYMPEEVNRLLTDHISDYLFTTSEYDDDNLRKEGISNDRIFCVGNVMVDSLLDSMHKAESSQILTRLDLNKGNFALLTLHRPNNVDKKESLQQIIEAIQAISQRIRIVFPAHPRTQNSLKRFAMTRFFEDEHIRLIEPLGYLDFLKLEMNARLVITDSGGIQEETTVLDIPCLTLRDTTEWPITISQGTNTLVGNSTQKIIAEALKILDGKSKKGSCPKLWDGKTAERIIKILAKVGDI